MNTQSMSRARIQPLGAIQLNMLYVPFPEKVYLWFKVEWGQI